MNIEPRLRVALQAVAHRRRRLQFWRKLAAGWGAAALIGLVLVWLERMSGWASSLALPLVALAGMVAAVLITRRHATSETDWRELAAEIEALHPELDGCLLTAVQQQARAGEFNYLQQRVVDEALTHSQTRPWQRAIPDGRLRLAQAAHWLALILFLCVLWGLRVTGGHSLLARIRDTELSITPGDTSIERGNSLVVLARFGADLPARVELVASQGEQVKRIPLSKSLADPVFGGSVPEVDSNFVYYVEYTGGRSREFKVNVFEYPRLERSDVDLRFPEFTGKEPKRIENTRRVSAVEGSQVDLELRFNKPVVSARLSAKNHDAPDIPLTLDSNSPSATLKDLPLTSSHTYELQLTDSDGRTNKVSSQFVFNVLTNRMPELRLASPKGDTRPSPLEEISFDGTVWDDFGVGTYGLGYTIAGQDTKFIELGHGVPASEKRSFHHVLRLEELGVVPDQLVAWFLWAEDIGADGKTRRTQGDLFFGEVRPFEEIFREGQGMEGQGSPSGQQRPSTKLADLQKQIINATWTLQREHATGTNSPKKSSPRVPESKTGKKETHNRAAPGFERQVNALKTFSAYQGVFGAVQQTLTAAVPEPDTRGPLIDSDRGRTNRARETRSASATGKKPTYQEDATVVRESQADALDQTEAFLEQQEDPRAAALWRAATKEMEKALERLSAASNSPALLPDAIAAEQAAYQALLKLQQHEYQVVRNRNRSQSGGGGSREQQMQRQLEQLDLTQSENRYETQRQAQPQQSEERREQLQVMNRLQELARRQQDLNERLKELQTALQEAKTEEEREEIRRRLKRLQEEEQQMLADLDELRQRMDRPENQSQMSQERQQLEQAREDIQKAAEAAAEGAPSRAVASGTRAQRQLQEMREQMRKQNSSRFAEDLKEMRSEARELARQQEQLQQKMSEPASEPKSLSDSPERTRMLEELARQRARMTNLVEQATQVSQEAEEAEPLLSRQLYDTVRKFSQESARSLKETQDQLLERGLLSPGLYDRLKESTESEGAKLLDLTAEMLRQDFLPPARQANERAGSSIRVLKEGVERAAESVLGDDTEALRLAQQQLDNLMDQLQREMNQQEARNSATNNQGRAARSGENSDTNAVSGASGDRRANSSEQQGSPTSELARDGRPGEANSREGTQDSQNQQRPGRNTEQAGQPGQRPGRQSGQPQSQQDGQGQNQPGTNPGEQASQEGNPESANPGEQTGSNQRGEPQTADRSGGRRQSGDRRGGGGSAGGYLGGDWDRLLSDATRPLTGPITGDDFGPWSDRLREVEEMVDESDLRNGVARARERARLMRQDYKREGKRPDWAEVRLHVVKPLVEVRDRIAEELARRASSDALVPIDRDPVPSRYSELVRRYYEELGKDK